MKRQSFFVIIATLVVMGLSGVFSFPGAAAETYEIDPVHSAAVFRIKHLGIAYVYGRFNDLSGTLKIDDKSPDSNLVDIHVKTKNVDTFNIERDNHLRSPDFFDAKKFPVISFKSKSFRKVSQNIYEVAGELTLHGVTRPLTVDVQQTGADKDPWGGLSHRF